jgi:hypothetical protein
LKLNGQFRCLLKLHYPLLPNHIAWLWLLCCSLWLTPLPLISGNPWPTAAARCASTADSALLSSSLADRMMHFWYSIASKLQLGGNR